MPDTSSTVFIAQQCSHHDLHSNMESPMEPVIIPDINSASIYCGAVLLTYTVTESRLWRELCSYVTRTVQYLLWSSAPDIHSNTELSMEPCSYVTQAVQYLSWSSAHVLIYTVIQNRLRSRAHTSHKKYTIHCEAVLLIYRVILLATLYRVSTWMDDHL